VSVHPLAEIIAHYAALEDRALTLLRLNLHGVLDPRNHLRIDSELKDIISNRYFPGSFLAAEDVLVEPTAEEMTRVVGDGVLSRVLGRLQDESRNPATDSTVKQVADHALKLLYRIAWEEQSA
jgi:hypothetical protein